MNKIPTTLILATSLAIGFAAIATGQTAAVQNAESAQMQEMLRPYFEPYDSPPDGPDKDRPSIKENALKIADALPAQLSAPSTSKRRILVLTCKTFGQLHLPGAAGLLTLLRDAENKYGAFELTEAYTSQGVDAKMLSGYDAVVLNNISQTYGPDEENLYNHLLPDYVKNGGGLFADHGVALIYMDHPEKEFTNLLGGCTWHNNYLNSGVHPKAVNHWSHVSPFSIKLIEPENPLAAAFRGAPMTFAYKSCQLAGNRRAEWPVSFNAPLELADELYAMNPALNKDHSARCIAGLDQDKVPKESFPPGSNDDSYSLIWIKAYGKGRVYYSELGHNQAVFSVPCVARAMLDGLQYVTGDLRVPAAPAVAAHPTASPTAAPTESPSRQPVEWKAQASSGNSFVINFSKGPDLAFSINPLAWGPNYAGCAVKSTDKGTENELSASTTLPINPSAGQSILLKERVWKSADKDISITYEFSSSTDVALSLFIAAIAMQPQFQDGDILCKHADGSEGTFPLGGGQAASKRPDTTSMVFRSKSLGDFTASIDPAAPTFFWDTPRIQFAQDSFKAGKKSVTVTFHLSGPVSLQPAPASSPSATPAATPVASLPPPADSTEWEPWDPKRDDFASSPIDLRYLNEKFAGEHGWIQAKGGQFVHSGNGQPVRFWGVNEQAAGMHGEALANCARMLAKHGVNLIRLHSPFFDQKTGEIKPEFVREKQEIVAAMKSEGIYTTMSIFFPAWLRPTEGAGWREGYDGTKAVFFLYYFEPEFQKLYQSWWKAFLLEPGPDGKKLIDDPALMSLEIINEDTFFFWHFSYGSIPAPQMRKLEKLFGDWAVKKYGSIEKALATWSNTGDKHDNPAEGLLGFRSLYDISARKTARDQDTAAFLLELQRGSYENTVKFLRGLGYKGMITCSNMTTANNEIFGPLEKYANTAGDYVDRHAYFGCTHKGENAGWCIRVGHTYSDVCGLRFDTGGDIMGKRRFNNPVIDPSYNGLPSTCTELSWERPNRYRSEAPLFLAAYGALQDSDGYTHFSLDSDSWHVKPNFWMQPWTLMSPCQMGQYPAAALIFRQGLVTTGDLMADLPMKLSDAIALKGSQLVQESNLDEFRKADVPKVAGETSDAGIDPLIHFVGRTQIRIDDKGGKATVKPLGRFIDRKAQTVTSSTGELKLDYGKGVLTINAPGAQGISGILKEAGAVETKDLSISSDMEFAHIIAVSMDGKPLATSSKIFVQAMSEEKPTDFTTETVSPNVFRITNIGKDPWLFRALQGTIKFKRPDAAQLKVTALDFNGYPAAKLGNAANWKLQPDCAYYLIER